MTSENKKIKNARSGEYNGIKFRSQLEMRVAKYLTDNNISFEYEPFKIELIPKFTYNGELIRAVHYTPDFKVGNYLLEVKGYPNDTYRLKRKLIMLHCYKSESSLTFLEIKSLRELKAFVELHKNEL